MASSSSLEDVRKIVREEIQIQQQTQGRRSENIYQRTQTMIRDAASAVRRQPETPQAINIPAQRSFIHDPAAAVGTNTPTTARSLQEENTPTDVQATIRNIWGGQKNSRKRSVPGHPGEWRIIIIMNTQKSFVFFYSFYIVYYFIFLGM